MADDIQLRVTAKDDASKVLDEVQAKGEALEGTAAEVQVTADDQASEVLDETQGAVEALDGETATVEAEADDNATEVLEETAAVAEELDGAAPTITPDVDDSAIDELEAIEGAVEELDGATPEIVPQVDPSGVEELGSAADSSESSVSSVSNAVDLLESRLASALPGVTGLSEGLTAIGGSAALAAGGGVAAIGFAAEKSAEKFEGLALAAQHFSVTSGATLDEASRWIEVSGDLGVSADAVESAIGRMNKGIGKGTLDLGALGIQAGTSSENFVALIQKLHDTTDASQRAALGSTAFGKGWQVLAPIIENVDQLNDRLDSVSDQKVITDEEVETAEQFRDAMDSLHDAIEDVEIALGQFAIGPLIDAAALVGNLRNDFEALKDAIPGGDDLLNFLGPLGKGGPMSAATAGLKALRDLTADPTDWGFGPIQNAATDLADAIPVVGGALGDLIGGESEQEKVTREAAEATAAHTAELLGQGTAYLMGTNRAQAFAIEQQNVAKSVEENAAAAKIAKFQEDALTKAHAEAVKVLDAHRKALAALDDQLNANRVDEIAISSETIKNNQALRDYDKTMHDSSVSTEDKTLALNDMTTALIKTAKKTGDLAADQSGLTLETDKAKLSIDTQIQSLEATAATLDPSDPLRQELANYIAELNGIKAKIDTEINVDAEQALAQLRAIQGYITSISGGVDIPIGFEPIRTGMAGIGRVPPGGGAYDVGEAGKERVILPGGSQLLTAGRTMMGAGGSGPTIVNHFHVNVTVSPLSNPAEVGGAVVNAVRAYERRSGKGWRAA